MLFLLSTSSKPISELHFNDVGFRKVSKAMAAIFVYRKKEEADDVAIAFSKHGAVISSRAVTREELAQLQTRLSGGTVKFVFELSGPQPGVPHCHESVATIEEDPNKSPEPMPLKRHGSP